MKCALSTRGKRKTSGNTLWKPPGEEQERINAIWGGVCTALPRPHQDCNVHAKESKPWKQARGTGLQARPCTHSPLLSLIRLRLFSGLLQIFCLWKIPRKNKFPLIENNVHFKKRWKMGTHTEQGISFTQKMVRISAFVTSLPHFF